LKNIVECRDENATTVEPLYKSYAWDIKLGLFVEVGCFQRLFSIVEIKYGRCWESCLFSESFCREVWLYY